MPFYIKKIESLDMTSKIEGAPNPRAERKIEQAPDHDEIFLENIEKRILDEDVETEEEKLNDERLRYLEDQAESADSRERIEFLLSKVVIGDTLSKSNEPEKLVTDGRVVGRSAHLRDFLKEKLVSLTDDPEYLNALYKRWENTSTNAKYSALKKIIGKSHEYKTLVEIAMANTDVAGAATEERFEIRDLALKQILSLPDLKKEDIGSLILISETGSSLYKEIEERLKNFD